MAHVWVAAISCGIRCWQGLEGQCWGSSGHDAWGREDSQNMQDTCYESYLLQSKNESCSFAWALLWAALCAILSCAGKHTGHVCFAATCTMCTCMAPGCLWYLAAVCIEKHVGVCQVKVTMVVGSPIEVPKVEQPSKEQVQQYLYCFITEMKVLFEKHKASAGYPELQLRVI